MPGMIELRLKTDQPEKVANVLIEAKIDGARHEWDGQDLTSERGIVRNDRFPHIVAELKQMPWKMRGEVAVPFGNVLTLNERSGWPNARFYAFDMNEWEGDDTRDADPADNRRLIEKAFDKGPRFKHLRYPFKWKNFQAAWAYVLKHKLEGTVLKELSGRQRQFKVKRYTEVKVPVVGLTKGAVKGSFHVLLNGVTGGVSAASAGNIAKYEAMLKAGDEPYAEIEYLFLTKNGKMFQPRLRRLGTKKEILG